MKRMALLSLLLAPGVIRAHEGPLLLRQPTVNAKHVVFSFADDLWIVPREGGDAKRLTTGTGVETDPIFSPDGKRIAFTGEYEGNTDVYIVPTDGGVPARLTYHPGPDRAVGWTPDGKKVLFKSSRNSHSRFTRLFTMTAEGGGLPEEVPLPMAYEGAYSPDRERMAYMPIPPAFDIDERFNGGGKAADYMIMRMAMPLMNYWTSREGADGATPAGNIYGPRAMIVNEMAGSGGDWLPWMFKRAKLGPLVGKRTWGGLVGIGGYPSLIDGGMVTAPHFAFYNPEGEWEVENNGVAPDYDVEFDPQLVRAGRDPQLEKALELVMKEMNNYPPKKPKRPAYPNYHK